MRFMILVKADKTTEAGVPPTEELISAMGKLNDEMAEAGVLIAAEGLQPSSKGMRIEFSGSKRIMTDGPFTEAKELIAGFTLIRVNSREEAIEWTSRMPFADGEVVEVRPLFEPSDFLS
ncbi:MAG: YciI family protein [Dehalococcoidia bacterium]